jgi:hypothetical protein
MTTGAASRGFVEVTIKLLTPSSSFNKNSLSRKKCYPTIPRGKKKRDSFIPFSWIFHFFSRETDKIFTILHGQELGLNVPTLAQDAN